MLARITPNPQIAVSDMLALLDSKEPVSLTASETAVEMPEPIRDLLSACLAALARNDELIVASKGVEVTAQEAADFLGVSRTTLNRLLDEGAIPFTRPNTHRRIRFMDLVHYRGEVTK